MLVQTEEKDIVRDTKSMALLNTSVSALERYKQKREQSAKLEKLQEDFEDFRAEMMEMKKLLQKALENNG